MPVPPGFTEQDAAVLGAGISAFVVGIIAYVRGFRRGQPTPSTTEAVKASGCDAGALRPAVEGVRDKVDEIHDDVRDMRDILVKLEDRIPRR